MNFKKEASLNLKNKARAYFTAVNHYDESSVQSMLQEDYKQHNPFVPNGRSAFIEFLPKLAQSQSFIENIRMIQDKNYIIMHHKWHKASPFGAPEMVAFHIIRFAKNGLIAEHWNVITKNTAPKDTGETLTNGHLKIEDLEKTEENKSKIDQLTQLLKNEKKESLRTAVSKFFHPNFIQHNPLIKNGIDEYVQSIQSNKKTLQYKKLHKVFGEGNFVLSICEGLTNGKNSAIYDLYRLKSQKIAEHWSVSQEIPTKNILNNNTMFGF